MPLTAVREALLRILALIEVGWIKGRSKKMRAGRACYCISGAYQEALKDAPDFQTDRVWKAIREATPFHADPISYNDAKGRTKADIVRLLKFAIEKASV
jgi:hypothetical protein